MVKIMHTQFAIMHNFVRLKLIEVLMNLPEYNYMY